VLIPLPHGTGTSLKTIEAMAGGKAVIGTSAAFRGLDVSAGIEAVVEDDLDRYPARIVGLLADDAGRVRVGGAARRFAAGYDYCVVYRPYLGMLEFPVAAAEEVGRLNSGRLAEQNAGQ
jgi:hypothetical protein